MLTGSGSKWEVGKRSPRRYRRCHLHRCPLLGARLRQRVGAAGLCCAQPGGCWRFMVFFYNFAGLPSPRSTPTSAPDPRPLRHTTRQTTDKQVAHHQTGSDSREISTIPSTPAPPNRRACPLLQPLLVCMCCLAFSGLSTMMVVAMILMTS